MKKDYWKYILGAVFLATISVWIAVISFPKETLRIIACDVGQGDATLAVYGKTQILIDGGPSSDVLNCLEKHIPYWDSTIELIILSHPQADHFRGLIDVFEAYEVENFVTSGLDSSSNEWGVLKSTLGGTQTNIVFAKEGMSIRVGLIYLDILHPSEGFIATNSIKSGDSVLGIYTSKDDPNDFSVVAILRLENFEVLLTGDIDLKISDQIAGILLEKRMEDIEYIKVPHHGSKNGLSENLLKTINPGVAVISSSKNNSYGHPHKEILELLKAEKVRILRTDEVGEIVVETNGEEYWIVE